MPIGVVDDQQAARFHIRERFRQALLAVAAVDHDDVEIATGLLQPTDVAVMGRFEIQMCLGQIGQTFCQQTVPAAVVFDCMNFHAFQRPEQSGMAGTKLEDAHSGTGEILQGADGVERQPWQRVAQWPPPLQHRAQRILRMAREQHRTKCQWRAKGQCQRRMRQRYLAVAAGVESCAILKHPCCTCCVSGGSVPAHRQRRSSVPHPA